MLPRFGYRSCSKGRRGRGYDISEKRASPALDLFAAVPESVVVIDTGNYYLQQRDGRIEEIETCVIESRWVEQQLGRPAVKASNNIYAQHLIDLGWPAGTGRMALPIAGDVQTSKEVVPRLLDELGFDGVDAGGLDESWRQQHLAPVYTTDFDIAGVKTGITRGEPPAQAGVARHPN